MAMDGILAIIFERLGPYHHARLNAAGRLCKLTAIELSAVDKTYDWAMVEGADSFRRETLFQDATIDEKGSSEIRKILWRALSECGPQVVAIPGWGTVAALLALEWCRRQNVPAIVMSDSQEIDEPRIFWKELIKSRIVKQFRSGFVAGAPHVDYLTKLGLSHAQIFCGYDAVDNNYFALGSAYTRDNAAVLRSETLLPEQFFLNSSRFIPKKNLSGLIGAYAHYLEGLGEGAWHLVILGDGPLRGQLETQIHRLGLKEWVHLLGFKQYKELPIYYGLTSVYIQASVREPWALTINEAMASGLPVLVSERCGCSLDLVREGVNGFTFDPYDVEELADLMLKLSSGECDLAAMGEASRTIIADWGTENFAANLLRAAEAAINAPMTRPTLLDTFILKRLGLR